MTVPGQTWPWKFVTSGKEVCFAVSIFITCLL
jgi:hypothetical protein